METEESNRKIHAEGINKERENLRITKSEGASRTETGCVLWAVQRAATYRVPRHGSNWLERKQLEGNQIRPF